MACEYRIWRSIYSDFATEPVNDLGDETCHACDTYTDERLKEIRAQGFNGIWVHALLSHIASAAPFRELSPHVEIHQEKLQQLIDRAGRFGIKVFLYIQPLRAVSLKEKEFWEKYKDSIGGSEYPSERALCISTDIVRNWLEDLSEDMASRFPELGGVILITSSELPAHCYSHWQRKGEQWGLECPRCSQREPVKIVLDQLHAVRNGIRRKSGSIEVIIWTWSWNLWRYQAPWKEFLDRLPQDIILLTDFERGGKKDFWKRPEHQIDEYCLSYGGPSEICRKTLEYARKCGMRVMVKLQLGTTHELASVVSLPMLTNIVGKMQACKDLAVDGFLGCWNFGSFPSANTALAMDVLENSSEHPLEDFLKKYFEIKGDVVPLVNAYQMFADAMFYFPFSVVFIYNAPVNYALAYSEVYHPGKAGTKPCGPSHLDIPDRGDSLAGVSDWESSGRKPEDVYSLEDILTTLPLLIESWDRAVDALQNAFAGCCNRNVELEINNALLIGKIWKSTYHAFQSYALRKDWRSESAPELEKIICEEIELIKSAIPLLEKDPRQGWHGEAAAYLFTPEKIALKIQKLDEYRTILKMDLKNGRKY